RGGNLFGQSGRTFEREKTNNQVYPVCNFRSSGFEVNLLKKLSGAYDKCIVSRMYPLHVSLVVKCIVSRDV
ncbi:MAG: hypothetical protein AN484_26875, partial [Aphanizomenon flos-aquae WA102]